MVAIHMSEINTPHFDLPFRWDSTGHAAVVEQDSWSDVANCVLNILDTTVGRRIESPGFGVSDPTFEKQPINLSALIESLVEQEPRAQILMEQSPDEFDQMIADVIVQLTVTGG